MTSRASFGEAAGVALRSLASSKLRSFRPLLGIILATTTLIAVMSVIRGMYLYIANNVADMGVDGFRVRRMVMIGEWNPKKFLEMQRRNPQLTREEYDFVRSKSRLIRELGMSANKTVSVVRSQNRMENVSLIGVTANFGVITNTMVTGGRFFSEIDDARRLPVAFIGYDLKDRLFGPSDPVGKTIELEGR